MPLRFESNAWYAIQVKAHYEIRVGKFLESKGYESFVPCYRVKRRWSDRNKILDLPLFPTYAFCRFDPEIKSGIMSTPGVVRIVHFGKEPAVIDPAEIESLQKVTNAGIPMSPHPFLKLGQRVEIIDGPLAGVRGSVMSCNSKRSRIVLSVELVQASVAVEVDEWLLALEKPRPRNVYGGERACA